MSFLKVVGAALAYIVAARIGGALSIPPDFASVVWPAAGVALSAFLLLRTSLAFIGILLGASFANLYNTTNGFAVTDAVSVITGVALGVAAALQGYFGAWLYRTYLSEAGRWDEPAHLLKFCIVVVLLGSVVSVTMGTLTLYSNGFITTDRLMFNWITWWIGDAIGVLLVTPMIQVVAAPENQYSSGRKLKVLLPVAVTLAVVFGLFHKSLEFTREKIVSDLEAAADRLAQTVEARLIISENKLVAYSALFTASEEVSSDEFAQFSERVMASDDAFSAVGWTEVVDGDGRDRWERYFRENGHPDFRFTEFGDGGELITATPKERYYPVLYIYPFEKNQRAFGLNLAANPDRKAALLRAAEEKKPIATAPITLAQETGNQKALIVYMPVFALNAENTLLGYASGVMKINGILGDSVTLSRQAGLRFNLYDISQDETLKIFEADEEIHPRLPLFSYRENFAGRTYRLDIFPAADFDFGRDDWPSYVILTGGFIIATLFLVFVLTTTGQIATVQRKVELRTRELSDAVKRANAASEAKSSFLANMSHELRTPLNAINGFLKLALDTQLTPVQSDYLQRADLATATLLGLINQTLNYARIESGQTELEQEDVRIRSVVRKMEALFGHVADENNLEFRITLSGDVPETLIGDELRIEQITLNLLSNAFKFTREGYVHLAINYDAEEGKLQIRVSDSGVGIPADKIQYIFSAFGQADASISRRYGGTGLGLSISRRMAQLMGGDILVRSTEGEGSEFLVYMYLDQQEGAVRQPETPRKNLSFDKKCVLIVEDIKVNQLIAQEFLHKHGLTTLIAENGQEAIDVMSQNPAIDLILMDVQMPVMDGYTATRKIREMNADIPIIGMTANAMDDDKQACLSAGMNDHIAKPIDPDLLLHRIGEYLKE